MPPSSSTDTSSKRTKRVAPVNFGTETSGSSASVEVQDQNEVSERLSILTKELDQVDSSDNDDDPGDDTQNARVTRRLKLNSLTQKHLWETGKLVGEKGKPSQIVLDAHLSSRANIQAIPAIRSIRISKSVWHGRLFTKLLLGRLKNQCLNPEDQESAFESATPMDDTVIAATFCQTFVDEYLSNSLPGLVPDFCPVYGALSTAVTIRPKTPKKTQEIVKRAKDKDRELPQVVKKLQASEMDASIDPTMQRVNELNTGIRKMFMENRKPICLMRLLVDRLSFQNTVQNFFCFSFLLKDNEVRIFLDDHQLPVCTPVKIPKTTGMVVDGDEDEEEDIEMEDVPDPTSMRAEEDKYRTIMMSLTGASWKELVETFYGKSD